MDSLCLECGLCCNGVIFADVQLQPDDDAKKLQSLGLALFANRKFKQPCTAFDGCRCHIYSDRPNYCRAFECLLLKKFQAGRIDADAALRIIRTASKRVETVKKILAELGDTDDSLALGKRFRRMQTRLENGRLDETIADAFGRLTLAVHDLNLLLSDAFYPGER